jgi:hypothetical protein
MPSKTLLLYRLQILTKYKTLGKTEIQEELNSFLPCYHTQYYLSYEKIILTKHT